MFIQELNEYWTDNLKVLLLHKAVQNPEVYNPDLLTGPTDRDLSLALALERKAAWCYLNRCNNNIYNRDGQVAGEEDGMIRHYLRYITAIFHLLFDQSVWLYFYRYII